LHDVCAENYTRLHQCRPPAAAAAATRREPALEIVSRCNNRTEHPPWETLHKYSSER